MTMAHIQLALINGGEDAVRYALIGDALHRLKDSAHGFQPLTREAVLHYHKELSEAGIEIELDEEYQEYLDEEEGGYADDHN